MGLFSWGFLQASRTSPPIMTWEVAEGGPHPLDTKFALAGPLTVAQVILVGVVFLSLDSFAWLLPCVICQQIFCIFLRHVYNISFSYTWVYISPSPLSIFILFLFFLNKRRLSQMKLMKRRRMTSNTWQKNPLNICPIWSNWKPYNSTHSQICCAIRMSQKFSIFSHKKFHIQNFPPKIWPNFISWGKT